MIKESLDSDKVDAGMILIIPVPDVEVHSLWTGQVDRLVPKYDIVFANDSFRCCFPREGCKKRWRLRSLTAMRCRPPRSVEDGDGRKVGESCPGTGRQDNQEINGVERVRAIAEHNHN